MRDTRSRGHTLRVTGTNYGAVAHAVLVCKRAFEHIGEYLHVSMGVRPEALAWLHTIFVHDA